MKKEYVAPTIEVISLEHEDIITCSNGNNSHEQDDHNNSCNKPWNPFPWFPWWRH